jgi:large subunit ribosomal protein L30
MAVTQIPSKQKKGSPPSGTDKACTLGDLRITLVRSVISHPVPQREVVKGLGLRKLNSSVIRKDCPEIRGMIRKVAHLVRVEALEKK